MKKSILKGFLALFLTFASIPYFVGLLNHQSAIVTIQNFTDKSDNSIEDVLRVYNFNLGLEDVPTFKNYYRSGIITIKNYQTFTN